MEDFSELERRIGVSFAQKSLLEEALTHRSYLNEHPEYPGSHNERMEFLGDAVLELLVSETLFFGYPDKPEGILTSWRAALVNSQTLADIAVNAIGLNDHIRLSRGEAKDEGRARQYILADALEALIGALYLDQGTEKTKEFINRFVYSRLEDILQQRSWQDAKSLFQEIAQERAGITPHYAVMQEWGPDHDKHFRVGVYLGEECIAAGDGPSKQRAQMEAASAALKTKGWVAE